MFACGSFLNTFTTLPGSTKLFWKKGGNLLAFWNTVEGPWYAKSLRCFMICKYCLELTNYNLLYVNKIRKCLINCLKYTKDHSLFNYPYDQTEP